MARAGRCPGCGEPVSPFAAGCAICGFDLEAHRVQRREPRVPAVSLPRPPRVEDEHLLVGLTALLVLFVPLFGLLLAVVGYRNPRFANAGWWFVGLGAVAVALLLLPQVRFGIWQLVY